MSLLLTRRSRQRLLTSALVAAVSLVSFAGLGTGIARAAETCNPGGDVCVITPDPVQTPVGLVTVTVDASNTVTVVLTPNAPTFVLGLPFAYPPGPPVIPGYARTSIPISLGVVNIDSVLYPPGPPVRTLPNLAVISLQSAGAKRARTLGSAVVFTPLSPPGPPT